MRLGPVLVFPLAALAAQCAPHARSRPETARAPRPPATRDGMAASADAGLPETELRTFDDLERDADALASGMHPLERGEDLSHDLVVDAKADTCVRVTFSASSPVTAELVDDAARPLAEATETARGALGERGPICVRRGGTLRLRFTPGHGRSPRVRFIAWATP